VVGWGHLALGAPATAAGGALSVLSAIIGGLVSASFAVLFSALLFWTISGDGVAGIGMATMMLLCGIVIPLPLYPEWLQPILRALPFRAMIDVPFRIYIGHIAPGRAPLEIAGQIAWFFALVLAGRVMVRTGMKRLVVQGG
jgi:ABC-2 type transport system permease protein